MKIFKILGKFLGAILVLVTLITMFLTVVTLAISSQLSEADFILDAFEEVDFFEKLPEVAAMQIHHTISINPCLEDPDKCQDEGNDEEITNSGWEPPGYFQAISESDWNLLLMELLPPEWLEEQVTTIITDLYQTIRSEEGDQDISLSLMDLKEHLSGKAGVSAITQVLTAQPECSKDDLLEMTRILEGKNEPGRDFLACQPSAEFIEKYTPQIEVLLHRSLRDVPNKIQLIDGQLGEDNTVNIFGRKVPPSVFINWVLWLINISPLINVILLFIIALLAVDSFNALGRWWGYPMTISGLIALGIALAASPAADFLVERFIARMEIEGFHPLLIDSGSNLALAIIRNLFIQLRNYSLILTGIGFTTIITCSVLKVPSQTPSALEHDNKNQDDQEIPGTETDLDNDDNLPAEEIIFSDDDEEIQDE